MRYPPGLPLPLGRVYATPGALTLLHENRLSAEEYLSRHRQGDWGDFDEDDWRANDRALTEGTRILSAYVLPNGQRLWIITEWDRSATTLLRPDEY